MLFLIPASGPQLMIQRPCCVKSCCGMVRIKESLLLIGKSNQCSGGSRFPLSLSESSDTVIVNKMC